MIHRNSQRKRPQLEMLERRETPTAGFAGALSEIAAAQPAVVRVHRHTSAISGSGTATLLSAVPVTGGYYVTGLIKGTADGASMTGTLQAAITTTTHGRTTNTTVTGTATFVLSTGDLDISFVTSKTRKTFTVTGGTGTYAGATGHGTLTGSVSTATDSLSFSFHGTVTTITTS